MTNNDLHPLAISEMQSDYASDIIKALNKSHHNSLTL